MIEKNVPIPTGFTGNKKYPFADMVVGDSVFFKGKSTYDAPATAARQHAFKNKRAGVKFLCRNVDGGLRIWRTQ